ncbi:MAG: hypothetical protein CM15mP47_4590 [Methanobacteriota archaeon]|nr:MAG: hypothetical protein CM15mP47_4590 [Euryarchaeota archaeon]
MGVDRDTLLLGSPAMIKTTHNRGCRLSFIFTNSASGLEKKASEPWVLRRENRRKIYQAFPGADPDEWLILGKLPERCLTMLNGSGSECHYHPSRLIG